MVKDLPELALIAMYLPSMKFDRGMTRRDFYGGITGVRAREIHIIASSLDEVRDLFAQAKPKKILQQLATRGEISIMVRPDQRDPLLPAEPKSPESEDVDVGSVVCLKGGGPPMTVLAIGEPRDTGSTRTVQCNWISEDGKLQGGEFDHRMLKQH